MTDNYDYARVVAERDRENADRLRAELGWAMQHVRVGMACGDLTIPKESENRADVLRVVDALQAKLSVLRGALTEGGENVERRAA